MHNFFFDITIPIETEIFMVPLRYLCNVERVWDFECAWFGDIRFQTKMLVLSGCNSF